MFWTGAGLPGQVLLASLFCVGDLRDEPTRRIVGEYVVHVTRQDAGLAGLPESRIQQVGVVAETARKWTWPSRLEGLWLALAAGTHRHGLWLHRRHGDPNGHRARVSRPTEG